MASGCVPAACPDCMVCALLIGAVTGTLQHECVKLRNRDRGVKCSGNHCDQCVYACSKSLRCCSVCITALSCMICLTVLALQCSVLYVLYQKACGSKQCFGASGGRRLLSQLNYGEIAAEFNPPSNWIAVDAQVRSRCCSRSTRSASGCGRLMCRVAVLLAVWRSDYLCTYMSIYMLQLQPRASIHMLLQSPMARMCSCTGS